MRCRPTSICRSGVTRSRRSTFHSTWEKRNKRGGGSLGLAARVCGEPGVRKPSRDRHHARPPLAPVASRFRTYKIELEREAAAYCDAIMAMPEMQEWITASRNEPMVVEQYEF